MKSSKRLDSVIFQLTPTRTRCDLVISANGKTEKVASGLLLPFLAHLKTAQDQIDKGGYSILLEPCPNSDTTWFTKGTVERFVRFVSNPEILERVYSLQSEILQLEKAIDIQSNNSMDLATMKEHQEKSEGNKEGIKSIVDASEENAIVLYKPETHPLDSNGSIGEHGNSKVQFLKVLETRKNVMHKEHGMAFARAVAAGFDIDHMAPLLSFAECFGASRLMEACLRFIDLWKQKHETGQWVEVETAESMTSPPNFPAINASGIIISGVNNQQVEPHGNLDFENNGKPVPDSIIDASCDTNPQAPAGQQEYHQGHFSYPVGLFPSWPANSPPGALPLYQQYPMQGVPFYHPYPGSGPFYPPPHPPVEDSGHSNSCRGRRRRLSMDSRDSDSESEELVSENGASQTQRSRKKTGKSLKKQPGVVVIRNINYVSSKVENSFESESEEGLDSGNDEETENKNFSSSKRVYSNTKSMGELNSPAEEPIFVKESGHWEAFQNFLLRDFDEKNHGDDHSMFGLEKNNQMKRRQNIGSDDPLACVGREPIEAQRRNISELRKISGNATRMLRSSNDDGLISREGHQLDNQLDVQFTEMNGRKLACRNNANDDFMTVGREGRSYASHLGDLLSTSISHSHENVNGISQDMTDESFIVPMRSMSLDQDRINERININMNSELSAAIQKSEDSKIGQQANYEPDYLSSMPERGIEKGLMGYDPTLEYEMQVQIGDSAAVVKQNKKAVTDATQLKKTKTTPDSSDKKKPAGQIRKGKSLKSAPSEDARARAEKLRSYKADLQKLKKEKEEEQQRRLDALKNERQKRIAARGTSKAVLSPSPQQTKRQFPTKTAISSYIGSKFSDAEPKSLSPLQRSKLRTLSLGTIESQKASKTTKSANDIALPKNRLTRSVPSLPESKKETKEVKPDPRDSMIHLRRLSEPKASSSSSIALARTRTPLLVSKSKVSAEPESQKIAGIINLDKSKAATLPELKIKSYKRPLETVQNESSSKETSQKVNKHQNGDDNNPIIDKTVVMFEPPKTSTAVNHEKVNTGYTDKEPPRASSAQTAEMPYQPPFARLSSVEDPCTRKSLYGVTPSMTSEKAVLDTQSDKALVSGFPNLKIKEILEAPEKPQVKDSPRGFKRLLNFGKKSHSSAAVEQNLESDKTRANSSQLNDNATYAAASSEVHSLKNLISQDGSSAGGTTTNKSSRHFSLLSPFRSKTSEKKSAA